MHGYASRRRQSSPLETRGRGDTHDSAEALRWSPSLLVSREHDGTLFHLILFCHIRRKKENMGGTRGNVILLTLVVLLGASTLSVEGAKFIGTIKAPVSWAFLGK